MAIRFLTVLFFGLALVPSASAQTVRFDTNVGNIDLVLNPNGLAELGGHVDNVLAYVESGRYDQVVLNRAVSGASGIPEDDFVLQFGGFATARQILPSNFSDFSTVESFSPVEVDFDGDNQIDFDTSDLSNARGTVCLALSSFNSTGLSTDPGTPRVNSGTSSFFVNVGDNFRLDDGMTMTVFDPNTGFPVTSVETGGFVPFAEVVDMSTVDYIMRLNQASISDGQVAGSDIPILGVDDNLLVYVERVFVLDPNPVVPIISSLTLSTGPADTPANFGAPLGGGLQVVSVPEPPALIMVIGALLTLIVLKEPRR